MKRQQLTYWKRSDNNLTHEWTLTDVGDWSALKTNGTSVSRTHSNAHEVTAVGATSLTHDVKGNLTANPLRNHNYTWDFDNRMSGADTDGDTTTDVSFEYDALGRRVKKGSTVYAYSGQQVIAEYASGANPSLPTEQYVYASYVDEPILKDGTLSSGTGIVYYSRNQQYSITGLTDTSGNVVERYSYSAYGDLTIYDSTGTSITSSAYANSYTYTGRRFDSETEIYHFRARMYDAKLGRFIGRDALGFVDGMNLYAGYFAINGTDPSGNVCEIAIRCAVVHILKQQTPYVRCGLVVRTDVTGIMQTSRLDGKMVRGITSTKLKLAFNLRFKNKGKTGPFKKKPDAVCRCLLNYPSKTFNVMNFEYSALTANTNWAFKCALTACNLKINWGKYKMSPPFGFNGWGPCKRRLRLLTPAVTSYSPLGAYGCAVKGICVRYHACP